MQVFIAEDNYYELERLRRQVQSWGSRHGGVSITAVQCVAEVGPADLRTYDAVFLDVAQPGRFVVDLLLPIDAAAPVEQVFVWESAKEALV